MTQKAEFNAEEWSQILEGAPTAAMIVIAAGKGGTIRESMSIGKAYAAEQENADSTELLDAIVHDRPELDVKQYQDRSELPTVGMTHVKAALDTLAAKATVVEAEDFKRFVYKVALTAAEAHKEGGFLGIGGTRVSEKEAEALARIAETLDYDAPPLEPAGEDAG